MNNYTSQDKLCILLSYLHTISVNKIVECVDYFGDYDSFANDIADTKEYLISIFDDKIYSRLIKAVKNNVIDDILYTLKCKSLTCVTIKSDMYPAKLAEIVDPPVVLFCKGDINLLNMDAISIVGTRKPSSYGKRVAESFTMVLAHYFVVVSGLAYGIDSIAHSMTISEEGKTIAVLAGGLDNIYPASNETLANRIISSGGLLVSELPPTISARQYSFPKRNRIVAGLSKALLVCQAPRKSGTFSTINFALDEGRDVFVVPGEIYDTAYQGSNDIIKSLQGSMVTTPGDITSYYNLDLKTAQQLSVTDILNDDEQKVVDVIGSEKQHFDIIVKLSGYKPQQVNIVLSTLQLKGLVGKSNGNIYWLTGGNK